jgi:CDP-diacylglycerol--serine O-phosphatidyltransferase
MTNIFLNPNFRLNFANLVTCLNILSGSLAINFIFLGNYTIAILFLWLAGLFDILDGKIARKYNLSNEFGIQLDSFADFLSFVITPVFLIYASIVLKMDGITFYLAGFALFTYIINGLFRLISFNINSEEGEVTKYFTGIPTPLGAILLWVIFLVFQYQILTNDFFIIASLFTISFLLNSKIKIKHI